MSYNVGWQQSAERQLTAIWLAGRDRLSISEAIGALDQQLQNDPHALGESREPGTRLIFAGPLELLIEVDDSRRQVLITNIRRRG